MRRTLPVLLILLAFLSPGTGGPTPLAVASDSETSVAVLKRYALLLGSNRYAEVRSLLEKSLERDPKNPLLHRLLGIAHSGLLDERKACEAYDRAISYGDRGSTAYGNRGISRLALGKFSDALADFHKAIEADPDVPYWYVGRAIAYKAAGKPAEAEKDMVSARKSSKPDDARQQLYLASIYSKAGEYHQALRCYNAAARDRNARAVALFSRAAIYELRGDRAQAMRDYTESIRLDPTNPECYLYRGTLYYSEARYREARADFERGSERGQLQALRGLAGMLSSCPDDKIRDGKRAVELALKARQQSGLADPNTLALLACAYAEDGQWDKAVHTAEAALKLVDAGDGGELSNLLWFDLELFHARKPYRLWRGRDLKGRSPSSAVEELFFGVAKSSEGDTKGGIAYLKQAVQRDPKSIPAHRILAQLLSQEADHSGALRHYTKCLELDPKNYLVLANRAGVYMDLGRMDEALADADKSLKLNPGYFNARGLRMSVLVSTKKGDVALAELDTLIRTKPNDGGLWFLRGHCLFHMNRYEEAVKALSKAIEKKPVHAWSYSIRAMALSQLGMDEEAKRDLRKCIRLDPKLREVTEAQMKK